ncbi:MAG: 3'(2'),5'-bisphosphate nucleotidase [bacterium]
MGKRYEHERDVGIEALIRAAFLCQRVQKEMVGCRKEGAVEKVDRSPVTIADYGAQAVICHALKDAFPDDTIVAEENSFILNRSENLPLLDGTVHYVEQALGIKVSRQKVCDWIDSGDGQPDNRFWTLDPVDGTKGFLRMEQYAVALALIIDHKVQLGILACPNLSFDSPATRTWDSPGSGSLYVAVAGQGTYLMSLDRRQTTPVQVSSTTDLRHARFVESVEAGHADHETQQRILRSFENTVPSIRMDGQTKYGMLARGAADIYLRLPSPGTPDYHEKIWDHAAGALIVEEAGGVVTDIHGQALDFSTGKKLAANQGIAASNGRVHQSVIEAIQKLKG